MASYGQGPPAGAFLLYAALAGTAEAVGVDVCFNVPRMEHGTPTASASSRFAAGTRAYFYFWRFT